MYKMVVENHFEAKIAHLRSTLYAILWDFPGKHKKYSWLSIYMILTCCCCFCKFHFWVDVILIFRDKFFVHVESLDFTDFSTKNIDERENALKITFFSVFLCRQTRKIDIYSLFCSNCNFFKDNNLGKYIVHFV